MTKLIFGDAESIKLAKAGEIPPEAVSGRTRIKRVDGCEDACPHCTDYGYECDNCGNYEHHRHRITMHDHEGRERCNNCKFLIE